MHSVDVAVIGGGLGGLMAGATLAKKGRRVLLLDSHYIPGGCATTFKRRDFVMEVGLHALDGLDDQDMKKAAFDLLEIEKHVDILPMEDFYCYSDGNSSYVVPTGPEALIEGLTQEFPEERRALERFVDTILGLRENMFTLPTRRSAIPLALLKNPIKYWRMIRHVNTTLGGYLDKNFKSEKLKMVLAANLGYYHDDPYSLSLIYFAAGQASYIRGGAHYIRGGSQKLSDYLADCIRREGGMVLLGKEVTRITVDKGAASGVTFRDAFNPREPEITIRATDVVYNAAAPLLPDLLPGAVGDKMRRQFDRLEPACSLLTVYLGFNTDLRALGSIHHSTMMTTRHPKSLADFRDLMVADPEEGGIAFVDYGQVDSRLAPPGKSFGSLSMVSYLKDWQGLTEAEYTSKKERIAATLIDRLDDYIPGTKAAIDYYEVGTPRTIETYTSNPSGTAYGFAQTPRQAMTRRPARQTSLKGLTLASAWADPGGGFSGAMISGWRAALEIMEDRPDFTPSGLAVDLVDPRRTRFISCKQIAEGTMEVAFEKPANFQPLPGQYAIIALDPNGDFEYDMPIRPMTILSHQSENVVRFAMRRSDSAFKRALAEMSPGEEVTLYGPTGDFLLPSAPKPVAFVVGGVGVTPVLPMLHELHHANFPAPVNLLYSDKTPEKMAYMDHFKAISHPKFRFTPVFTATQPRMNGQTLQTHVDDLNGTDFYLVGSREFLTDMDKALTTLDVPKDNIHRDDFG